MHKCLTFVFLALALNVMGQTAPQRSDFSVDFSVVEPEDIAGIYSWAGTSEFGPAITSDICGELIWVSGGDESLGCDPTTADLTGKIALIRRGECDFSQKIYYAQEAGAMAAIVVNHLDNGNPFEEVNMAGGAFSENVTIPAIFISNYTGVPIVDKLENNITVEVCLELSTFNRAFGPLAYQTPISQVVPMSFSRVSIVNITDEELVGVSAKLTITEPSGNMVEFEELDTIAAGETGNYFFDSYLPEEVGEYTMRFESGFNGRVIERKFEITDYTWGMDDGLPVTSIGPSETLFEDSEFLYWHGNMVLTGENNAVVTHISFGLGNGEELYTGDPSADIILFAIYNVDKDGDGNIDEITSLADFGDPLEFGIYEITGNETFDNLVTVPFQDPVSLDANGIYYTVVVYDGTESSSGVGPSFSCSQGYDYLNFPSQLLKVDDVYNRWAGNLTIITQTHLEGFVSNVQDLVSLNAEKLRILNNPVVNNSLNYELQLEASSERVDVLFRNIEGKLISHETFNNVSFLNEQINVKGLPPGTYFLNVNTEEGFRSEKIIIPN